MLIDGCISGKLGYIDIDLQYTKRHFVFDHYAPFGVV